MLNPQRLYDYIDRQWEDEILPSLCDYIKIPNKSPNFDNNWQQHGYMEQAVKLLSKWCLQHAPRNMQMEVVRLEGRTPLIFIEIAGNTDETVLLYGHFDKQPEISGWDDGLGPWTPVLKDGKLYGRGGADDGYSIFAALTAINALQQENLTHDRCVIIIEGCEESGSYDLPFYIDQLKEKIGYPKLIICLDSGAGNYEQLWVTTSLRGNIVGELSVELITEGVHSGASGIIADSFRVARELLSRVEDEETGEIKLSALHCDIPSARRKEAADCAAVLEDSLFDTFPFHPGVQPVHEDYKELILNRTWRPALSVTGAEGLPALADAGNVLRPKTTLKLSMRIPPTVDADSAGTSLKKAFTQSTPYGAKVSYKTCSNSMGWEAPKTAGWLVNSIQDASMTFFNKPAIYMGEGGTIPFMAMLGDKFPDAQFMITGVLGPHSNAHGPNEFLHLDMVKKITACVALVLHKALGT
jgi:acetylornithine deacetylase/succinyl-diaminopimelate desuccinylase-like protein